MVISAGILIKYKDKVLLAHPTKAGRNMWGIPKGKVELNESYAATASRETQEEIGVYISPDKLTECKEILYRNSKTNKVYKKIYYYTHVIESLEEIGLKGTSVPKEQLGQREIDKARFMSKDEASEYVFWRQKNLLDTL
jgi:8-oxo-dGTP pyrophosphatase MutT (NUDIX family)